MSFPQKHIQFLLIIFLSFVALQLQAQQLNHVQGQLMIQLDRSIEIDSWVNQFNKTHSYQVVLEDRISPVLDVYKINFDFTAFDEQEVLLAATLDRYVDAAQYNHFVSLRSTVPNDPEFINQWQYINTGQGGGLEGADIDMDLAWDYTTGGVTVEGDTIVVCIIDDGIDNDHPDILPNLFVNHAEIPDNGIDDDENGFIDDYRGWRTSQDNDNVYTGGGHGTPVTGIIGAKGNDGFGVAGVNWNVKLMIVRGGSGLESEVLEAYSYPYTFRKRYNETNGEEGAFVVSTNASWGTDFGQPDDAPLWCAFYDTLGAQGVLSCGATINGNQNVDEVGDLPTACSSNHLIAVTNMNRDDVKVTGAGYGQVTIDLGAFGQGTWTNAFGGGFGGFGGTSGATPHVTGTIGLIYSMGCPNLIALSKSDPAAANLLIKSAILSGTDPNTSLEGITVSGGRLNVKSTMDILLTTVCGDCLSPLVQEVELADDMTAVATWTTNDTTEFVNLRWRQIGAMSWDTIEMVESPYTFGDLEMCESYEFQLQSTCTNSVGEYLLSNTFSTAGCCDNPIEIAVSNVNETAAEASWDTVPAATAYNLRYRAVGATEWIETVVNETNYSFEDLDPCTFYEFQLQSICLLTSPDYTESTEFFTLGCTEGCTQLPYCEVVGYNGSEEWISLVSLAGKENISLSDNGYGEFLGEDLSFELAQSGKYLISISPDFEGNTYSEYFRVWLDSNQDGVFDENTELIFLEDDVSETVGGIVAIPEDAVLGNTRMRVAMRYNQAPTVCTGEGFDDFGEVEDYCINIVEFTCPTLGSIDTTDITENTATITWAPDLNFEALVLEYRNTVNTTWEAISLMLDDESVFLDDLDACSDYEYRFRSFCPNNEEDLTEVMMFSTLCTSQTISGQSAEIDVYPNPFRDHFVVESSHSLKKESYRWTVVNQLGQAQNAIQISAQSEKVFTVVMEDVPTGVYYLQILDGSEVVLQQKVVKL